MSEEEYQYKQSNPMVSDTVSLEEADQDLARAAGEALGYEHRCHDCGAREGEFHKPGCDMERCPFCGGQLISCECAYKQLGIDVSPGTWAYNHGLTEEQAKAWDKILRKKGLIPYTPTIATCSRCGQREPRFFSVSDRDWKKYVPPELQNTVLCRKCYDHYKKIFPHGWRKGRRPTTARTKKTKKTPTLKGLR